MHSFGRLRAGWWESAHALRAVRQFAWLEVGSGKAAVVSSRPPAVGWLRRVPAYRCLAHYDITSYLRRRLLTLNEATRS